MNEADFETYIKRFTLNQNISTKYVMGFLSDAQNVRVLTEIIFTLEMARKDLLK